MKCINCGNNIEIIVPSADLGDGYFPLKMKCSNCNLEWTQAEHIDDMTYLIQAFNALKAEQAELRHQNEILQEAFDALLRKLQV